MASAEQAAPSAEAPFRATRMSSPSAAARGDSCCCNKRLHPFAYPGMASCPGPSGVSFAVSLSVALFLSLSQWVYTLVPVELHWQGLVLLKVYRQQKGLLFSGVQTAERDR